MTRRTNAVVWECDLCHALSTHAEPPPDWTLVPGIEWADGFTMDKHLCFKCLAAVHLAIRNIPPFKVPCETCHGHGVMEVEQTCAVCGGKAHGVVGVCDLCEDWGKMSVPVDCPSCGEDSAEKAHD